MTRTRTLNNGVEIPWLGLGTFKVDNAAECVDSVREAIAIGYRLIDTASIYGNEEAVGEGIRQSGIPREELFVTTKLWNDDQGYDSALRAYDASLKRLGLDYVDCYLIHWPGSVNPDAWRALETLYAGKRVRTIGVSNFKVHHLETLAQTATITPVLNQTELHPQYTQPELDAYCRDRNIALQGWGPLMQGRIGDIPLLRELAEAYGKTVSQIALRWALQKQFLCIPKSTKPERLRENVALFDFELRAEDMERIATLATEVKIGMDPDAVHFSV